MPRIALGLFAEGIASDDALPFLRGADEEVRLHYQAPRGLGLEQALEVHSSSCVTSKYEIAALEQGSRVTEAHLREQLAQVRHGDWLVAGDIDGPEEGQVGRHDCVARSGARYGTGGRFTLMVDSIPFLSNVTCDV